MYPNDKEQVQIYITIANISAFSEYSHASSATEKLCSTGILACGIYKSYTEKPVLLMGTKKIKFRERGKGNAERFFVLFTIVIVAEI